MNGGGSAPRCALHVFATFGAGGPQIRMTQLAARMGPGWRHEIVALDGDIAAAQQLPPGIDCALLPRPAGRSFPAAVRGFAALLRARRADVLLTYNWGSIECVAAARWLGLRAHVHHEDGFGPAEQQQRLRRRNWLRRAVLGRASATIVPSLRLLAIAQSEWRLGARVLHLPNGVDAARFCPAGDARRAPLTIGAVGGLRGEKDHATLLRAVAAMRESVQLRLVGDGPERARLVALAQELGIAARVVFVGAVADTAPCYRGFDVFALSSRTEQMPISLLEAMASGLPVASTDVGDVAHMLPAASRGGIVPAGDATALAAALDALARDPARRAREGAANRAHCAEFYDLGACLDRFVAEYERAARPWGR